MITSQLMISLLIILVAAWFMGSVFRRYGLPFVLGELVAGILMAFITTIMAPLTLRWSVTRVCSSEESASFCSVWEDDSTS